MALTIEPGNNSSEDHPDVFVSLKAKTIEWYKCKLSENDEDQNQAIMQILPDYHFNYDSDEDHIVK
jgi:hypothetical protein